MVEETGVRVAQKRIRPLEVWGLVAAAGAVVLATIVASGSVNSMMPARTAYVTPALVRAIDQERDLGGLRPLMAPTLAEEKMARKILGFYATYGTSPATMPSGSFLVTETLPSHTPASAAGSVMGAMSDAQRRDVLSAKRCAVAGVGKNATTFVFVCVGKSVPPGS